MNNSNKEITLIRLIDAPRELVFNAWVDPVSTGCMVRPNGFTSPLCEIDARPGGAIRIDMTAPDGSVNPMNGTVHELIPNERLAFTTRAFNDAQGVPQVEVLNMVTFEDYRR